MQVLLVEDDSGVRRVLARMLQRAGHDVIACENGLDGIARLKTTPVDLVLTDIVMPGMDGVAFIRAARQLNASLKVIAMSGGGRTSNMDHLQTALQLGACVGLHKPFTAAELQAAIERCCGVAA